MDAACINDCYLKQLEAEFLYKGRTFVRILSPARVQDLDGVTREYYASANDELVEDALRKIATEQQSGYFDKPNYRSGVVFMLYALREELRRRGHARSIKKSSSHLTFCPAGISRFAPATNKVKSRVSRAPPTCLILPPYRAGA